MGLSDINVDTVPVLAGNFFFDGEGQLSGEQLHGHTRSTRTPGTHSSGAPNWAGGSHGLKGGRRGQVG